MIEFLNNDLSRLFKSCNLYRVLLNYKEMRSKIKFVSTSEKKLKSLIRQSTQVFIANLLNNIGR